MERNSSVETNDSTAGSTESGGRRKWTSALKVVQAVTRIKNLPVAKSNQRHLPSEGPADLPHGPPFSNESTPSRSEAPEVDPIYLALKQATKSYGQRRGSSNQYDSATPSPRNLSQVSLQDSGYAETTGSRGQLLGSTPQLAHQASQPPQSGPTATGGRPRAPKLNKQMKSLSLDCADAPPPVSATMRSQFRSKPIRQAQGFALSNETSDWEQGFASQTPSPRRVPVQPPPPAANNGRSNSGSHIVTHEYAASDSSFVLCVGDRLHVLNNGDPDWLHGFRTNDRSQQLLTFPATCVAAFQPEECPMRIIGMVHIPEAKLRLYRGQVVFAQPDSMVENARVLVRTERGVKVHCAVQHLDFV
ncbi:hypothetical protein M3Y99_01836700 [Aphelenchoides fujianensis]|nr:hypothetical protein M3Y99_01836700 [Aphelenchoides fujianensis]